MPLDGAGHVYLVVAPATPYLSRFPRLTPVIHNTPDEVERALEVVRAVI